MYIISTNGAFRRVESIIRYIFIKCNIMLNNLKYLMHSFVCLLFCYYLMICAYLSVMIRSFCCLVVTTDQHLTSSRRDIYVSMSAMNDMIVFLTSLQQLKLPWKLHLICTHHQSIVLIKTTNYTSRREGIER